MAVFVYDFFFCYFSAIKLQACRFSLNFKLIFFITFNSVFTMFCMSWNIGSVLRSLQSQMYFCKILVTTKSIKLLSLLASLKNPKASERLMSLLLPNTQAKNLSLKLSVIGQLKKTCKTVSLSCSTFLVKMQNVQYGSIFSAKCAITWL